MQQPPDGTLPVDAARSRSPLVETGAARGAYATRVPVAVDRALLETGRDRFEVLCAACHGILGDGASVVATHMALRKPPSLLRAPREHRPGRRGLPHDRRWLWPDALVPGSSSPDRDAWAVVAYLEALRLAQHARVSDLPPDVRDRLSRGGAVTSRRLVATSLCLAAAGLAALVVGLRIDPTRAWFAYLDAWLFGTSIAVGALLLTMTGHAAKAGWMVITRRPMESVAATLPLFALLFVPLAFGLDHVYPWAGHGAPDVALAHALDHKRVWLSKPFFVARTAVYFLVFCVSGGAAADVVDRERRAPEPRARPQDAPPQRRRAAGRRAHAHVGVVRLEHVAAARLVLDDVRLLLLRGRVRRCHRARLRDAAA